MIDPHALRRLRTDRGLSQRRLAAATGVDPLTVKRLEEGADAGDLPCASWNVSAASSVRR